MVGHSVAIAPALAAVHRDITSPTSGSAAFRQACNAALSFTRHPLLLVVPEYGDARKASKFRQNVSVRTDKHYEIITSAVALQLRSGSAIGAGACTARDVRGRSAVRTADTHETTRDEDAETATVLK